MSGRIHTIQIQVSYGVFIDESNNIMVSPVLLVRKKETKKKAQISEMKTALS